MISCNRAIRANIHTMKQDERREALEWVENCLYSKMFDIDTKILRNRIKDLKEAIDFEDEVDDVNY